jgi:hypothetical protein
VQLRGLSWEGIDVSLFSRVLVPPRTENTYILDTLVRAGVEFGTLRPPATRKLFPILMTLIPFMYVCFSWIDLLKMYETTD